MLVSIPDFATVLDAGQLQKGRQYFESGAVGYATEVRPGQWKAEVSGTDEYYVTIKLEGDTVIRTRCDCPHDDPFCKHVVAVLFSIQQQKGALPAETSKKAAAPERKKAAAKPASFEAVLERISEKELKAFLKTYAARNKEFRNLFLLRFELAGKAASRESFAVLIRETPALYTRRGFIEWEHTKKALQPVLDLLDEAEDQLNKEAFRVAFDVACAVVLEVPPLLDHMDDSDGIAGDCVHRAFELLEQLAESTAVPYTLKDELFSFAQAGFGNAIYSNYHFDAALLQLLVTTAHEKDKQQRVFALIDKKLSKTTTDHARKWLLDAKLGLLQRNGCETEMQAVLQEHITIPEYRERLLQQHLDHKDYEAARKLAQEGIQLETVKQSWQRHKQSWEAWLLKIVLLQKDVPAIRQLCKSLYFGGSFDHRFYELCRKTYSKEEWQPAREAWIKQFPGKHLTPSQQVALAQIYIAEQQHERLLQLLLQYPTYEFATFCKPYLQDRYAPELLDVYRQALIAFAAESNSRSQYIELRKRLKMVQQTAAGKAVVNDLVTQFLRQYKQRRAMKEELEKLNR